MPPGASMMASLTRSHIIGLASTHPAETAHLKSVADGVVARRIGTVAPEIVGTDLDGVEFKLSDYRGKVVALTCSITGARSGS